MITILLLQYINIIMCDILMGIVLLKKLHYMFHFNNITYFTNIVNNYRFVKLDFSLFSQMSL